MASFSCSSGKILVSEWNQVRQRLLHRCACHELLDNAVRTGVDEEIPDYIMFILYQEDMLIVLNGAIGHDTGNNDMKSFYSDI